MASLLLLPRMTNNTHALPVQRRRSSTTGRPRPGRERGRPFLAALRESRRAVPLRKPGKKNSESRVEQRQKTNNKRDYWHFALDYCATCPESLTNVNSYYIDTVSDLFFSHPSPSSTRILLQFAGQKYTKKRNHLTTPAFLSSPRVTPSYIII